MSLYLSTSHVKLCDKEAELRVKKVTILTNHMTLESIAAVMWQVDRKCLCEEFDSSFVCQLQVLLYIGFAIYTLDCFLFLLSFRFRFAFVDTFCFNLTSVIFFITAWDRIKFMQA